MAIGGLELRFMVNRWKTAVDTLLTNRFIQASDKNIVVRHGFKDDIVGDKGYDDLADGMNDDIVVGNGGDIDSLEIIKIENDSKLDILVKTGAIKLQAIEETGYDLEIKDWLYDDVKPHICAKEKENMPDVIRISKSLLTATRIENELMHNKAEELIDFWGGDLLIDHKGIKNEIFTIENHSDLLNWTEDEHRKAELLGMVHADIHFEFD